MADIATPLGSPGLPLPECAGALPADLAPILGIGDSLLVKCIVQTFGRTTNAVKEQYDEVGDLGIVAELSRSSQKQLAWGAKPASSKVLSMQLASSTRLGKCDTSLYAPYSFPSSEST